nr:Lrp/AsnC ligand binding domain-containing protein [Ardenticatenales bacterium]
ILECYHVTGEFDYLLKGVFSNRQALEHFLVDQLALLPAVVRVHTSVVFSEVKSSSALPIS